MDEDRRKERRDQVRKTVQARIPATPIAATLLDISKSGCMAQVVAFKPDPGTTVVLDLAPDLTVSGQVVWQRGERFGVKFHHQLNDDEVATMVEDQEAKDPTEIKDKFGRSLPPLNKPFSMRRR